jgi:hypothetical protein
MAIDSMWTIVVVAGVFLLSGFLFLGFFRRVRRFGAMPNVDQNVQRRVDEDVSMIRRLHGENTPWI